MSSLANTVKQLEFWFSDANLVRDGFLRAKVMESDDHCVPVSLIAGFKKMKDIAGGPRVPPADVEKLIARAAHQSSTLKVSKDGTRIGRATPFTLTSNAGADERTVYCELFPPDFDHDKLRALFESIAPVAHVAMPRYHESRAFKGFAFVEFATVDGALRACSGLNGWTPESFSTTAAPIVAVPSGASELCAQSVAPGLHVLMKAEWEALKSEFTRRADRMRAIMPVSSELKGVCVRFDGIHESVLQSALKDAVQVAGCVVFVDYPGATRAHQLFVGSTAAAEAPCRPAPQVAESNGFHIPRGSAVVRYSSTADARFAVAHLVAHPIVLAGQKLSARLLRSDGEELEYLRLAEGKKKPAAIPVPALAATGGHHLVFPEAGAEPVVEPAPVPNIPAESPPEPQPEAPATAKAPKKKRRKI